MEIRTVLDLFSVIPAIFDLEVYFPSAMFLFYLITLLCFIFCRSDFMPGSRALEV